MKSKSKQKTLEILMSSVIAAAERVIEFEDAEELTLESDTHIVVVTRKTEEECRGTEH